MKNLIIYSGIALVVFFIFLVFFKKETIVNQSETN